MNETEYLIDWIHKSEWIFPKEKTSDIKGNEDDKEKGKLSDRLPSLVTDLHFEHILSKRADLELLTPLSFGWAVRDAGYGKRYWYKISESATGSLKSLSKAFVTSIAKATKDSRFFVLTYELQIQNECAPVITWGVIEIALRDGDVRQTENQASACELQKNLFENVNGALNARLAIKHDRPISPWLSGVELNALKRLLVTRCFMNFSGFGLTDIDAVGMDESGKLQLIEFKRKGPASGYRSYQMLPHVSDKDTISRYFKEIEGHLKSIYDEDKISAVFHDEKRWKNLMEPCFGLDTSHIKNVELCAKAGMVYRYIIWNTTESYPNKLFDSNLRPKFEQTILVLEPLPKDVAALTYTIGITKSGENKQDTRSQSGAYKKGPRFQFVFPVQIFRQILGT